jgi:rhodanese-related sulfurtransferase
MRILCLAIAFCFCIVALNSNFAAQEQTSQQAPPSVNPISPVVQIQPIARKTGACDFDSFVQVAQRVQKEREQRLLSAKQFVEMASEPGAVALDARSQDSFELVRVKGSKNLPYTNFGEVTLGKLIPHRGTKILIYCRNNLENKALESLQKALEKWEDYDDEEVVTALTIKQPMGGLNIPVAITLRIYGYENVWELDEIVDPWNSPIPFEITEKGQQAAKLAEIQLPTQKTQK